MMVPYIYVFGKRFDKNKDILITKVELIHKYVKIYYRKRINDHISEEYVEVFGYDDVKIEIKEREDD